MNNSMPQLPEYEPDPNSWARIEAGLRVDDLVKQVITQLPEFEPEQTVWKTIEQALDTDSPTVVRPLWPILPVPQRWALSVAAAVLCVAGCWLLWPAKPIENVRIEYTVEHKPQPTPAPILPERHTPTASPYDEAFIARQCAKRHAVCQRPEVHELRKQLTALTLKKQDIEHERQLFGDDPALVQAQSKVEQQRAELTKELIILIGS